jgi:hypothetical protein
LSGPQVRKGGRPTTAGPQRIRRTSSEDPAPDGVGQVNPLTLDDDHLLDGHLVAGVGNTADAVP